MKQTVAAVVLLAGMGLGCAGHDDTRQESNVVVVTVDGVRWREVFGGADDELLSTLKVEQEDTARAAFWRPTREERRRALMPFLWSTVAEKGQLIGNVDRGSEVRVTNAFKVSYPGYHELLCGFPSPSIDSNDKVPNPDMTVLEWLARKPAFQGQVAAFAAWDVFAFILDRPHAAFSINLGEPIGFPTAADHLRGELKTPWPDSVYDAFVVHNAMEYLEAYNPRVLYMALGDTDEWGHAGHYDRYLEHLHRVDGWLADLWTRLQASPAYHGRTSLIITTDHGRGDGSGWRRHGADSAGSEYVWVAAMGPSVAPAGDRQHRPPSTQSQFAATIAAMVGEDFTTAHGGIAPPLPLGQSQLPPSIAGTVIARQFR